MRVTATPATPSDGPKLADEILATMADVTRNGTGEPRGAGDARDAVGGGPDDAGGVVDPTKAQTGPHP